MSTDIEGQRCKFEDESVVHILFIDCDFSCKI